MDFEEWFEIFSHWLFNNRFDADIYEDEAMELYQAGWDAEIAASKYYDEWNHV